MRRNQRTLSVFIFVLLFALSACAPGQDAVSESAVDDTSENSVEDTSESSVGDTSESSVEETAAESRDAVNQDTDGGATKMIRLGSSPYSVRIAREFTALRVSNEDWEDDMVASYYNDETLLDFRVYQFSKEGYPDTLEEFIEEEAEEYDAYEIVTGENVNGIPMGYYRCIQDYSGMYRDGVTCVFENGDEYIELDFWFIGYQAESEAREIVHTLTRIDSEILTLGAYQIRIPRNFTLIFNEGEPVVYQNGNPALRLYVNRFPAEKASLADFARLEALRKGGSDIETDANVNGFPVASYRAVEPINGAFRSTLTYILDDGGGFTALTFCLDGITAEAEAEAILATLQTAANH